MKISMKNVGIVSNSEIDINGLTVITGHNNSGKTTVGKVMYSLVDAVSDIENKAKNDKYNYVLEQLERANRAITYRFLFEYRAEAIQDECLRIFFSRNYAQDISRENTENYLLDLINELKRLNLENYPYNTIIGEAEELYLFERGLSKEDFADERNDAVSILENAYYAITKDPLLINYAKQSIYETLSVEFSGQIQPAALDEVFSAIEMTDGNKKCFSLELYSNELVNTDEPIYNWSPYENTFFIDNPYIVGEPVIKNRTRYTKNKLSYVDETHIFTHENKLKLAINNSETKSVFKSGIIGEKLALVKEKMDAVLPGEFIMTGTGQDYVQDGVPLKAANLATGSKMFSIIKLLLEKGEITDKTLLILDEPEAHLHPKWQSMFAEMILLMVKEIGCHILLTTHSSHFMLAIDAYMRKHNAQELCNFYQTRQTGEKNFVEYNCVNDSLDLIYKDFVAYLSEVKMLRNEYMHG